MNMIASKCVIPVHYCEHVVTMVTIDPPCIAGGPV